MATKQQTPTSDGSGSTAQSEIDRSDPSGGKSGASPAGAGLAPKSNPATAPDKRTEKPTKAG